MKLSTAPLTIIVFCQFLLCLTAPACAERPSVDAFSLITPSQFVYESTQKSKSSGVRGEFILETAPYSGNTLIAVRGKGVNFHLDETGVWRDRKPGTYENSLQVEGTPYPLVTLMSKAKIEPKLWKTIYGPVELPRSKAAREFFLRFGQPAVRTCLKLMATQEVRPGEYPLPSASTLTGPISVTEETMLGVSVWSFKFAFVPPDGKRVDYRVCLSQDKAIPFLIESVQEETGLLSTIRLTSCTVHPSTFKNV